MTNNNKSTIKILLLEKKLQGVHKFEAKSD